MGFIPIVFGAIAFLFGFSMSPDTVQQQSIQYTVFLISTVFLSSGFICIAIQYLIPKQDQTELSEINRKISAISDYYEKIKADESAREIAERKAKQDIIEVQNIERLKSYTDILDDPKIREEAEYMLKCYGTEARDRYLSGKRRELEELKVNA